MKIVINVNDENAAHWCISGLGEESHTGTVKPGEQVALEIGAFRLIAVLVADESIVSGHIDPDVDNQVRAVLDGLEESK